MPTHVKGNRPVQNCCHWIWLLGTDESGTKPEIIHGPWIAFAYFKSQNPKAWERRERDGRWQPRKIETAANNGVQFTLASSRN